VEQQQLEIVFKRIEKLLQQKNKVIIAIEGSSASGKTTLGKVLEQRYECNVFHMDDFFLQLEQRTKERLSEPGGNVDRERFLEQVLFPLKRNETIQYRRFDCSTFTILPAVEMVPRRLNVIEGAYSTHPAFGKYYDLSVFLDITPELQKERILKRNADKKAERFFKEWIPMEHRYFEKFDVKKSCDVCLVIS